tara:strand:+ start:133 stop:840 length:708 start_codon:yes stop_codon:yes gene_type:complete
MKTINLENINIYEGHSQKNQHCYVDEIFKTIGTTNKYYVDIGAYDGVTNSNVIDLKLKFGWDGLMIDNNEANALLGLHKHSVTKDNICDLLGKYKVPQNFDFLSLDIDGMDYWILNSLLTHYKPRVIVVESNVRFKSLESNVLKYKEDYCWDGLNWYGASPYALKKLSNKFGYTPIYVLYDDVFIIENQSLSEEDINKPWETIYPCPNVELYKDHIKPYHPRPVQNMREEEWMEI